ncbi:MAG TPA: hypothetical protein VLM76_06110 [Patescibacteria group bacterium]|nr:hypothetical protein [Patescibacteria group bacterium]
MSVPPVDVRTYRGRTQGEAESRLAADEAPMSAAGYTPSTQSWAEAVHYGAVSKASLGLAVVLTAGGWLVAPPLSIVAMVFLVIGMITRTRTSVLTVTWTREGPDRPMATPASANAPPGLAPDTD